MSVTYEWDCETVAAGDQDFEDGEVIDHAHGANFKDVKKWSKSNPCAQGFKHALVLVRDDDEGRSWAYLDENGMLPKYFTDAEGGDAAKVPQRFVREVAAA